MSLSISRSGLSAATRLGAPSHGPFDAVRHARFTAAAAMLLAACAGGTVSDPSPRLENASLGVPATAPSLTGVVAAVAPNGQLRLEHRPLRTACSGQALATPDAAIRVVRRDGVVASPAALTPGVRVSVWFGPIAIETCPVQVTAVAVVIEP